VLGATAVTLLAASAIALVASQRRASSPTAGRATAARATTTTASSAAGGGTTTAETHVAATAAPQAVAPKATLGQALKEPAQTPIYAPFAPPPVTAQGRYQDYTGDLRVAVASASALSAATARVVSTTRSLGGYVVAVDFGQATAAGGASSLDVRVPVARVQQALAQFSALGRIEAEHVRVVDVQGTVDALASRIAALRLAVAKLQAQVAQAAPGSVERATLGVRLVEARSALASTRRQRTSAIGTASYAALHVGVDLPRAKRTAAAPHGHARGLGGSARHALSLLRRVGDGALFAAIVVAPFALLCAALAAAWRVVRRRRDRHLLEQV
jgi:hypothetical protein